ncbi:MAG: OmpA family protein [Alphaproteobacteria bacterium]|nr:OmpA family protein [Alphaproteobacteria bacterium]MDP6814881.1 OmpA family protein [Alphaproteobacteria bacterium]
MNWRDYVGRNGGRRGWPAAAAVTLAALLGLSGCAQVPTWVNPVNWVEGLFDEDVETLPPAPKAETRVPGQDKPFPKLSADNAKPGAETTPAQRRKIAKGLVADRDSARYSDQNLRAGQGKVAAPPPPKPTRMAAKPAPAPKAALAKPAAPKAEAVMAKPAAPKPAPPKVAKPALHPAPTVTRRQVAAAPLPVKPIGRTSVPSIVQRSGRPPLPPPPVVEVTNQAIPRIVQRPAAAATAAAPTPRPVIAAAAPAVIAPPAVAARAPMAPPPVQVNLPVGQDQSVLAQTFAASLAAQGGNATGGALASTFNAPAAAPIAQWPTRVPTVVQQAYNASLSGGAPAAPAPLLATPQRPTGVIPRLPGAPVLIRFSHGSSRLGAKAVRRLAALADEARQGGKTIHVVGHASQRTGDMPYAKHKLVNFNVSLDRANRVAGELRRRGVAAERISVVARGDEEPLYFEFMPDGEAKNRRVEVFLR